MVAKAEDVWRFGQLVWRLFLPKGVMQTANELDEVLYTAEVIAITQPAHCSDCLWQLFKS